MKISLELSSEQAEILQIAADRLGLKPAELARASLADLLGLLQEDFKKAATYVMQENEELYRRLC
ncbi:MAG: hypothetical protein PHU44_15110 [Syntrophales bacterium]|nr:hypothetical protein [Syntrophales bacterium]MDD5642310.1 hypothetical protein [Syntrophales bacterium]